MPLASPLLEYTSQTSAASPGPHIALVQRSRVLRDFVLLITVCMSIGLAIGLVMMAAVFALF